MRFQYKLILTFALFLIAAIGSMFYFFDVSQRQLLEKIDKDLENVTKSVHFSTQKLATENSTEKEQLTSFIEEATRNKSVKEITVVNRDNQVVASSNPKKVGLKRSLTGQEMIIKEEFGAEDDSAKHNRYVINIPIIRDGKPIGIVQTTLVLNDFSLLMREYSIKEMIAAVCALLGIFIISWIVLLRLSKPISMLTDAAKNVAEGDLSSKLPAPSSDELGQLSLAFGTMVQKLGEQKKIEEKISSLQRHAILSETAAIVSHEIRNPLNLINLTADHLAHMFKQSMTTEKNSEFEVIIGNFKAQIRQLNRMVDEFLAIGKPAKLARIDFNLEELVGEIERLVKQQIVAKKISLVKNIPAAFSIYGDREQLQLVILNILINAIDIIPEPGTITIDAQVDAGNSMIRISDNGPGIAPENVEKIFEPYFTRRTGGTGLGLTLARRIIEQHGDRVCALSNQTVSGGCFEIRLPHKES
jgi:signal transduction histidine kinase